MDKIILPNRIRLTLTEEHLNESLNGSLNISFASTACITVKALKELYPTPIHISVFLRYAWINGIRYRLSQRTQKIITAWDKKQYESIKLPQTIILIKDI